MPNPVGRHLEELKVPSTNGSFLD
ncbi:hypothetical protein LCGC14_0798220, partial [marine sediment metagenome]